MQKKVYKKVFLIGAIWNWLITISFFFFHKEIFQLFQMTPLNHPVVMELFASLVFTFGLGYYWAAKNPFKNISAIKLGIICKTLIFLILFHHCVLLKDIPLIFIMTGIADVLFAALFFTYVKQSTER